MASNIPKMVVPLLLLLQLSFTSLADYSYAPEAEKKIAVFVEGKVYCQSCKNLGSSSLSDAEPIPSAKISIYCKNLRDQFSYNVSFDADDNGYFYGDLEGFKTSHSSLENPLQSCRVKLVSPRKNCSLLSNLSYGAALRFEKKKIKGRNYEAVIYAAGPLVFRPANCHTTHP